MVSDAGMLEEMDAGLAHASALLLAAADKIHTRIQTTDEADELVGLTKSLEGATRALRLTYSLRMKLRRDAQKAERETSDAEARRDREQVRFRKQRLETAIEALVWRETEDLSDRESWDFDRELEAAIEDEALSTVFLTDDIADQVGRVLTRLGFEVTPEGAVKRIPPPQGEVSAKPTAGASAPTFDSSA